MALAFSPEAEARFQRLLTRYPERRAALIPTLVMANREFGWLSREATATFYTMLRKKPVGKHHIQVCINVACYLKGANALVAHLEKRLGIGLGEVTPDGLFSLEGVQCLAACGTAPAIQVGDDYHEDMTIAKLDALIDGLRAGGAA
jgi:NADH-quinone oxidoreductase subunit E